MRCTERGCLGGAAGGFMSGSTTRCIYGRIEKEDWFVVAWGSRAWSAAREGEEKQQTSKGKRKTGRGTAATAASCAAHRRPHIMKWESVFNEGLGAEMLRTRVGRRRAPSQREKCQRWAQTLARSPWLPHAQVHVFIGSVRCGGAALVGEAHRGSGHAVALDGRVAAAAAGRHSDR